MFSHLLPLLPQWNTHPRRTFISVNPSTEFVFASISWIVSTHTKMHNIQSFLKVKMIPLWIYGPLMQGIYRTMRTTLTPVDGEFYRDSHLHSLFVTHIHFFILQCIHPWNPLGVKTMEANLSSGKRETRRLKELHPWYYSTAFLVCTMRQSPFPILETIPVVAMWNFHHNRPSSPENTCSSKRRCKFERGSSGRKGARSSVDIVPHRVF